MKKVFKATFVAMFALSMGLGAVSCSDDDKDEFGEKLGDEKMFLPTFMTSDEGDYEEVTITYDDSLRISQIVTKITDTDDGMVTTETETFTYNEDGTPAKYEKEQTNRSLTHTYTYEDKTTVKIKLEEEYRTSMPYVENVTLTLNDKGQMVKKEAKRGLFIDITTYKYDAKGNMIEEIDFDYVDQPQNKITCTYTDIKGAYSYINMPAWIKVFNDEVFSKYLSALKTEKFYTYENGVAVLDDDETQENTCVADQNGMLKTITWIDNVYNVEQEGADPDIATININYTEVK